MRAEIAKLTGIEKETIDMLFSYALIDVKMANAFLIYQEFKQMQKENPEMSKHFIHAELAAKHNASPSSIYKWCKVYENL